MEFGYILLILTFISSLFAGALFNTRRKDFAEVLLYLSTSLGFATLLLLTAYFVKDVFTIWYVYSNSDAKMPLLYKISAVWSGKEGSILLWVVFNLILTSWYINLGKKDERKAKVAAIMSIFTSYLLLTLLLFYNPFEVLPYTPQNGVGLNPLLRTIEMILHPPVVFLSYALASLLFAISLAKGDEEKKVARFTWIALTLGIVIGGWWAYRTLGWGGFWGWDPVENASLLPWITLTLYFHLREGREFFAYLTFTLVMLATFITRSGIISSVHSFGGEIGDYSYLIPVIISLVPLAVKAKELKVSSFCNQYIPLIFSSAVIVVFLGTMANIALNVERTYYLFTFLPLFALMAVIAATKVKKMVKPAMLLHLGVILLFVGSTAVWVFEEKSTVSVSVGSEGELKLNDFWIEEDNEKLTVLASIKTAEGVVTPKVYIYKIERQNRVVSSVEIIPSILADDYFAIKDYDLKSGIFTVEHYRVPLINFVWIGAGLMVTGSMLRVSGKLFKLGG